MSAETGSGIETIHVRLLDEVVDVWRPAQAVSVGVNVYRLLDQPVPDEETWEFGPGDEVVTGRRGVGADAFVVAVARSSLRAVRERA